MNDIVDRLTDMRSRMNEAVVQMDKLHEQATKDELDLGTIQLNVKDVQYQMAVVLGSLDGLYNDIEEDLYG